ncbi:MAG: hypothetical protein WB870_00235 [Gallionellaceae bacterium]
MRTIAAQLGRFPSTISREPTRNGGPEQYRASLADRAAWDRTRRPKLCKRAGNAMLRRVVATKLKSHWAPEQIAGWLKRGYPGDEDNQVSHETLYRSLFIQARGVLKKEFQLYLRSQRAIRRSRHATMKGVGLGKITHAVSISSLLKLSYMQRKE